MLIEFRYPLGMQKSTLGIGSVWPGGGHSRRTTEVEEDSLRDGHLDADLEVRGGLQDEGAAWVNEHAVIGEQGCRTEPGCRRGRGDWE